MREFIIEERKKPKLVKSSPGIGNDAVPARPARPAELPARGFTVVSNPTAKARSSSRTSASSGAAPRGTRRNGHRQFVVSYAGSFVGFFEAEADITPREAFIRVAADLAAGDDGFDPEKLEIYKPVLLRGARPANGCPRVRGKLKRVPVEQK